MTQILVTGSQGQLGQCLALRLKQDNKTHIFWESSKSLDITKADQLKAFFKSNALDYCVNCAAYTAVDLAESEQEKARAINATAVNHLATLCQQYGVTLIHISTDYVFNGKTATPYLETDPTAPINVYGQTKLLGEQAIQNSKAPFYIIRTSWLYSQFGKNFYKSIRSKLEAGQEVSIVTNQIGTPTNANDLAELIVHLIQSNANHYGLYHFSNAGEATWFDFAKAIAEFLPGINTNRVVPIDHYATFAQRPGYSVLSKQKLFNVFEFEPKHWKDSLAALIKSTL